MKKLFLIFALFLGLCGCTEQVINLPIEPDHSPGEEMFIVFPSLEHGYCSLIKTSKGKNILVGCGESSDFPVLYEMLKERNVTKIDALIIISDNSANYGGFQKITSNFEISEIYVGEYSENISQYKLNADTPVYKMAEGTRILDLDKLCIDVVSSRICDTPHGKKSAVSLYMTYGDTAVFFEGDGDFVAERDIIATMGESIRADIICVPHSASSYLPSEELLSKVNPKYAVMPVYNGNYPLMHLEKILREKSIETVRTDTDGSVVFILDGINIKYHIQK